MNCSSPPFTDRARRALQRADAERERLGHQVLTAQHLAWALLAEQGSVAMLVLRQLSFDLSILAKRLGPEWHTTGPAKVGDEDPVAAAVQSARALGHASVDTAHLLLGLLRTDSRVSKVLRAEGVTYAAATEATVRCWTRAVG